VSLGAPKSGALGFCNVPLRIPDDPVVVGLQGFAQFFWPDSCSPNGWSASNALSITVQP
jgi:hypothetical protein